MINFGPRAVADSMERHVPHAVTHPIFVVIRGPGLDEFYMFRWQELQQILREDYKDGPRPKNPDTLHHALYPKRISHFRDNWKAID